MRLLWEHVASTVGQQQQASFAPAGTAGNTGAPPSMNDPVSGPAQLVSSLWNSYGPGIIASGTALLRQSAAATVPPTASGSAPTLSSPAGNYTRSDTTQSLLERKRKLEAELAALSSVTIDIPTSAPAAVPMPGASGSVNSRTSSSSDLNLRERTTSGSGGRFEEIEVPSDVEGYDIGDSRADGGSGNESSGRPGSQKRGSWFGWGGSPTTSKGGYERVKTD